MKIRLINVIILSATLVLSSCSSDDEEVLDTQNPAISIIEPHDDDELPPGGELHFEAIFADNVELASYKIDIHANFDDHGHAVLKQSQDNPWSYSQVFQIPAGQTTYTASRHIDIPAEITEGIYDVGVFVTDAAGNESQAFVEVHIETGAEEHTH